MSLPWIRQFARPNFDVGIAELESKNSRVPLNFCDEIVSMKSYTITAAAASILFGVCLFVSGCGTSQPNQPKMETSGSMMSPDSKMSGNMMTDDKKISGSMMSEDKMSSTNKRSGPKMNGMSDGKMDKGEATNQ